MPRITDPIYSNVCVQHLQLITDSLINVCVTVCCQSSKGWSRSLRYKQGSNCLGSPPRTPLQSARQSDHPESAVHVPSWIVTFRTVGVRTAILTNPLTYSADVTRSPAPLLGHAYRGSRRPIPVFQSPHSNGSLHFQAPHSRLITHLRRVADSDGS